MRRHAYLWVGLGPLIVLLVALVIFEWSAPAGAQLGIAAQPFVESAATGSNTLSLPEARARYEWLTTVLLNLLMPLFAIVCFALIVRKHLAPPRQVLALGLTGILCGAGMGLLFLGIATESALHRIVFDFTYEALQAAHRFTDTFLHRVLTLMRAINGLAVIAPSCALIAFVSTVLPGFDRRDTLQDLRARRQSLRDALNISAALLVSGILHMSAWLRWSAALVDNKTTREGIEHLTLAVTLFWGMTFTLMIVAAYVPATMILRARALELFRQTGENEAGDPEKWLAERGFKHSVGDQLPQVAVMLAPLMAGPAASLFGALSNWGQ